MTRVAAKDLTVGMSLDSSFAVHNWSLVNFQKPQRSGEQYLKMTLGDRTGTVEARAWERGPELAGELGKSVVVRVLGKVTEFQGSLQVVVEGLEPVNLSDINRGDFLPVSPLDPAEAMRALNRRVRQIRRPALQQLLLRILDKEPVRSGLIKAPGGKTVHHATVGGLLQHIHEVWHLSESMAKLYSQSLDLDLLFAGAVLHDLGKIAEYDLESLSFELTDQGRLVGHIPLGYQWFAQVAEGIKDFPLSLREELGHMILAHHGKREWGSPVEPQTPHAWALFLADYTSSRLARIEEMVSNRGMGDWTEFDRYLGGALYLAGLPQPKSVEPEELPETLSLFE